MSERADGNRWARPGLLAVVAAGAGLAFLLTLWLGAYGGDLLRSLAPGPTATSRSVEGFYGLRELLEAEGLSARARPPSGGSDRRPLLVAIPREGADAPALRRLIAGKRALVVLPKWISIPDVQRPGWSSAQVLNATAAPLILRALAPGVLMKRDQNSRWTTLEWLSDAAGPPPRETDALHSFQTLSGALDPLVRDAQGEIVLGRIPGSQTLILSDPDLIDNGALRTAAGAELATQLLLTASQGEQVQIDASLGGGAGGRNALRLFFEPPFGAVSLCLLAAAALMALRSFTRFGSAPLTPRAYGFGKAALVESTLSLLHSARREPDVAPAYARGIRSDLARSMGLASRSEEELDAELDRLSARGGLGSWTELKSRAPAVRTSAALTAFAKDLFHWSQEMKRERR